MKKNFWCLFFSLMLIVVLVPAFAIEIDRAELESAESEDPIVFINYTGPHQIINTIDEIREIGTSLGNVVKTDTTIEQRAGELVRYYVIHAVDTTVTTGLDADILILGEDAIVDHVDNLRRIIAAYVETTYDYTRENAETLATFITVYNAVYRGQMDIFNQKYKSVVTQHLTIEKAGLSINYTEWAGNTQIIIPLAALDGGLGTIDTSIISDSQVVESLRGESDMAIDDRKDLVEMKEQEAEIATEKAQEAQQEAAVVKQEVAEKTEKLEEIKQEIEIVEKEAEAQPDDPVIQEKLETLQTELEKQEEDIAEVESRIDDLEQSAEDQQDIADTKQADAQSDRIEIAEDQQQLIREATEPPANVAYGLKIVDTGERLSALVLIDTNTGLMVKESPVNVIRNRTIYLEGKNYIAVAGQSGGNAAVRLVKIDDADMEIIGQSDETLATDSVLVKDAQFYYVIIQEDNNYYTAKYNGELELILKSDVAVLPETPITITDLGIMITDSSGSAKLLRAKDLSSY